MNQPLFIAGMHGLGDNLHQRAVVRQLARRRDVWLETPWPCVYHDMPEVRLVGRGSKLRTQARNAAREAARYTVEPVPADAEYMVMSYAPADVRRLGSVLAAMCQTCGVDFAAADFRMDVPTAWLAKADEVLKQFETSKPLMVYRPMVERREWGGNAPRNPDRYAYRDLFNAIRDRYFVISLADLVPGIEWSVNERVAADVQFHGGELDIETIAGLFKRAALVFTPPGFPIILAQSVGTPVIAAFGGYETSQSFSAGARYSPYLGLDVLRPCQCFAHHHACDKSMDVSAATKRIEAFLQ